MLGKQYESKLQETKLDSLYYLACDKENPRQRMYQALYEAQALEARAVVRELEGLGVEPILFKGTEVTARCDKGRAVGERHDVDLLVQADEIWKAEKVLFGRGYIKGDYDRANRRWVAVEHRRRLRHELGAYELWPFRVGVPVQGLDDATMELVRGNRLFVVEEDDVFVPVKMDVHHNILFDFDAAPLRDRTVESGIGVGLAPSPADHLWFLIFRYYGEVTVGHQRSLRPFVAIAGLIADPGVDWEVFLGIAVATKSCAPCYYWLRFFQSIGVATIPKFVVRGLKGRLEESSRNWGWQVERLFEVEHALPAELS